MIRKAKIQDAEAIFQLIHMHSENGQMLSRSLNDIQNTIADFFVYEDQSQIIGACGLNSAWNPLIEIRSLAVHPMHFGKGVGTALVQECLNVAIDRRFDSIFVLTYAVPLFQKLGFQIVEKSTMPLKVWNDCQGCHKRDNCDEIAMALPLKKPAIAEIHTKPSPLSSESGIFVN